MVFTKEELHKLFLEVYKKKGDTITLEDVGKTQNVRGETIRRHIILNDAYEDCPDVFMNIQKPLHQFDQIDEESAYWIGYLLADGCIAKDSRGNSYRLMLECKTEDKEILEKFCDFLQIRKNRITSGHKGNSVALSMATSNFTSSFKKYGIVPNKSHVENTLPEIFKENQKLFFQFLKGLIDGDGTVHANKGSYGVSVISNSNTLIKEIKEELVKYLPNPQSIWIIEKTKEQQKGKNATQSLFILKVGTGENHANLKFLYENFYNNSKIILTRKEQLLKSIL